MSLLAPNPWGTFGFTATALFPAPQTSPGLPERGHCWVMHCSGFSWAPLLCRNRTGGGQLLLKQIFQTCQPVRSGIPSQKPPGGKAPWLRLVSAKCLVGARKGSGRHSGIVLGTDQGSGASGARLQVGILVLLRSWGLAQLRAAAEGGGGCLRRGLRKIRIGWQSGRQREEQSSLLRRRHSAHALRCYCFCLVPLPAAAWPGESFRGQRKRPESLEGERVSPGAGGPRLEGGVGGGAAGGAGQPGPPSPRRRLPRPASRPARPPARSLHFALAREAAPPPSQAREAKEGGEAAGRIGRRQAAQRLDRRHHAGPRPPRPAPPPPPPPPAAAPAARGRPGGPAAPR